MSATLGYRSYRWHGGDEWLAEIGDGPPVLLVPPLFEELNRCRALLAGVMRGLAAGGMRAVLPDLPGTGESLRRLEDIAWTDWIGAVGLVSFDLKARWQVPLVASFRGGCLTDQQAEGLSRWRFAPVTGAALMRDLVRAKQATMSEKTKAAAIEAQGLQEPTEFAGYVIPPAIFAPLRGAGPANGDLVRTVRLESDPAPADLKLTGKPLWRQSEPGNDHALATALAADIIEWHQRCAG